MCLYETHGKVWVGIHLPYRVSVHNNINLRDALLPLHFKFALEHVIRKVQVNQRGRKLNVTRQFLVCADYVTFQDKNTKRWKKLLRLKIIKKPHHNIQETGRLKNVKVYDRGIWNKDEDFPIPFCLGRHRSAVSYTHTQSMADAQEEQRCKMLSFLWHIWHITYHRVQINNAHLCFSFTLYTVYRIHKNFIFCSVIWAWVFPFLKQ